MFAKLFRLMGYMKLKAINDYIEQEKLEDEKTNIPKTVKEIKEILGDYFSECPDFVNREIELGEEKDIKLLVVFMNGLVSKEKINQSILRPILDSFLEKTMVTKYNLNDIFNLLKENLIYNCEIKESESFKETLDAVLSGDTIIYLDGIKKALRIGTQEFKERSITESGEIVVRGPREGFVENVETNIALLRKRVRNPRLKFEYIRLGVQTNTEVYICYIKDIVHNDIVKTVRRRLKKINIDAILDSGYIEEFIEDEPLSIFPTVGNTEKPDIVAGKILEGRVAILCDGSPVVLTVPYLFVESFQSSEDYYTRWYFASLARMFTILGFLFSVGLPGVYVALVTFHQDVIPIRLLLTIASAQEGIPLSPFTEAVFMGLVFEILIEAGVRMPKPIGQAISIVGALVLGDAVVQAGLISSPMIIITAITAISSFLVPHMRGVMPFLRFIFIIAANVLGFMGIMLTGTFILLYLCSLRSFGVPYLSPFSPISGMDLKDTFIRTPLWTMITRPKAIIPNNADKSIFRMKKNYIKKED